MDEIVVWTPVHEQHAPIGRVVAVDTDPQTGAIAILVQTDSGELRRLAPGTYHVVDGIVVVDTAPVNATAGEVVPLPWQDERS